MAPRQRPPGRHPAIQKSTFHSAGRPASLGIAAATTSRGTGLRVEGDPDAAATVLQMFERPAPVAADGA
ncbi:MAG TPA: hypothetical protein VKV21_06665 [Solirubrobacteraceae bacterium]|nr:hypothetical protein [Solirubrobacteraceae bacterium]